MPVLTMLAPQHTHVSAQAQGAHLGVIGSGRRHGNSSVQGAKGAAGDISHQGGRDGGVRTEVIHEACLHMSPPPQQQ